MRSEEVDRQVRLVLAGNTEAFAEIVRLTQYPLRAFILSFCPWKEAVDDIAQEVYVYLYQHLGDYELGTDLYAWMRSLARNRILSHARSLAARARQAKRFTDARLSEYASRSPAPPAGFSQIDAMRDCLERLEESDRSLLRRRYSTGERAESLAKALGKTASALRVRIMRIRRRLRRCLEGKMHVERGIA